MCVEDSIKSFSRRRAVGEGAPATWRNHLNHRNPSKQDIAIPIVLEDQMVEQI